MSIVSLNFFCFSSLYTSPLLDVPYYKVDSDFLKVPFFLWTNEKLLTYKFLVILSFSATLTLEHGSV